MKPVNEASTRTFTVEFYGTDGQPSTPTAVEWRLRNLSSGVVKQDWTAVTPGALVEIVVPASLHVISDDRNRMEDFAFGVRAESGLDGQYVEETLYQVKNLKVFRST